MTELLQRTEVQIVILIGLVALSWGLARLGRGTRFIVLTLDAKRLLDEIRKDARSNPKGVSIYLGSGGLGSHIPFRWKPEATNDIEPFTRDITTVRSAVDELVSAGLVELETTSNNWQIYRLVTKTDPKK